MAIDKAEPNDAQLERLLDLVDKRTEQQTLLHAHLADGFLALARERYRDPSSIQRLGKLAYDNRDRQSGVRVQVGVEGGGDGDGGGLRRRRGGSRVEGGKRSGVGDGRGDVRNSFVAIPSAELRDVIKCFRMAVDRAVEVVNATGCVEGMLRGDDAGLMLYRCRGGDE